MTSDDIQHVYASWIHLHPHVNKISETFYRHLFESNPEFRAMFKNDMIKQGIVLMETLNVVINSLDDLETLTPVIKDLGKRHTGYGVKNDDYNAVGNALLQTLKEIMGENFTIETETAWKNIYTHISGIMQQA